MFLTESNGNQATIEIVLVDLPEINEVVVNGVKKQKQQEIITENKLNKGVKVTENLITTTKNFLFSMSHFIVFDKICKIKCNE